jgi:hypothetical protein
LMGLRLDVGAIYPRMKVGLGLDGVTPGILYLGFFISCSSAPVWQGPGMEHVHYRVHHPDILGVCLSHSYGSLACWVEWENSTKIKRLYMRSKSMLIREKDTNALTNKIPIAAPSGTENLLLGINTDKIIKHVIQ